MFADLPLDLDGWLFFLRHTNEQQSQQKALGILSIFSSSWSWQRRFVNENLINVVVFPADDESHL